MHQVCLINSYFFGVFPHLLHSHRNSLTFRHQYSVYRKDNHTNEIPHSGSDGLRSPPPLDLEDNSFSASRQQQSNSNSLLSSGYKHNYDTAVSAKKRRVYSHFDDLQVCLYVLLSSNNNYILLHFNFIYSFGSHTFLPVYFTLMIPGYLLFNAQTQSGITQEILIITVLIFPLLSIAYYRTVEIW